MTVNSYTVCGRHYANGEPIRISIHGDRIERIDPAWPQHQFGDWPFVAPALLDLQINGYGGTWFSDETLTSNAVLKVLQSYYQFGVTRLCPTLITNSFEGLAQGFTAIRLACEQEPWANRMVCGCHLEGPYISSEDGPRGAHPREHVRPCDWAEFERLQDASGQRIALVTLAPEAAGAIDFIQQAVASGVVISIGHTAATPEQIQTAVNAGATLSTHLGNGTAAMMHRHRNVIIEQLADARLYASLIVDGHHLPASLVKVFVEAKTPQRTILTCDAAGWAGCPPGIYENKLGRSEILASGKLVVAGQHELLAGSAQGTDTCIVNAIRYAGVTLKEAIDMAGKNPATLLRQDVHRLRRGSQADLVLFKVPTEGSRLNIETTIASGELKFGNLIQG